jgi:hypothetical protein
MHKTNNMNIFNIKSSIETVNSELKRVRVGYYANVIQLDKPINSKDISEGLFYKSRGNLYEMIHFKILLSLLVDLELDKISRDNIFNNTNQSLANPRKIFIKKTKYYLITIIILESNEESWQYRSF